MKLVPFVRKQTLGLAREKRHVLLPFEGRPLQPDEEMDYELLHLCDLQEGAHFLDIPVEEGLMNLQDPVHFPRKRVIEFLANEDVLLRERTPMSVVASNKVQVLSCARLDFAKLATNEMLIDLVASRSLFHVEMRELQEQYLQKRQWGKYKKDLLQDFKTKTT